MLPTMDRAPPPPASGIKSPAGDKLKASTASGLRPCRQPGAAACGREMPEPFLLMVLDRASAARLKKGALLSLGRHGWPCRQPMPTWITQLPASIPLLGRAPPAARPRRGYSASYSCPQERGHPWEEEEGAFQTWPLGKDALRGGRRGEASFY